MFSMYCFDLAFKGHTAILSVSLVFGTMIGAMVLARMQLACVTLARVTLASMHKTAS